MTEAMRRLPWDSEFFAMPVATVPAPATAERVRAGAEAADREGIRCLTALVDAADTAGVVAAEEAGFRCYDIRVELERPVELGEAPESTVREATLADRPALEAVARERFAATRFFADPHFPRERAAGLYVAFLDRASRSDDRRTLVTRSAKGFVVCVLDRSAGTGGIELIGVANGAESNGDGGRLMRAAHALFASEGLSRATVVTQGRNLPGQRLFQREGYRTCGVALWMHRWRDA
jgi:hypothetical protein